ncbi:MAG: ABC transporter permease [Bdellovibrionia bacterium]
MTFRKLVSPFGCDMFCLGKKFLVFNLITRNLKTKYHRSALGFFWTLASPLLMALVYYFAFKMVLKVSQPHFMAVLISGVITWSFFAQTLVEGADSIVGSWGLLSKVPIPLQVFPFVGALTNLVTLLLALPVILGVAFLTDCQLGLSVFFIPIEYALLFVITYSLSYFLSVLFVYFRDLKHVIGVVLQVWFYATPVIYVSHMVPEKYRWLVKFNPVAPVFMDLQNILIHGAWPEPSSVALSLAWASVFFLGVSFLSSKYFVEVVERI